MATVLIPTLQKAFCGVLSSPATQNVTATATDAISNSTTQMPHDFSSLLTFLFSFSALHDWLKLIIIGGLLESSRRFVFASYYRLINSFFITAIFADGDDSYDWMMVWLSKQPSWGEARELQISTKSFGLNRSAVLVPGEEEDASSMVKGSRRLAYLPSFSTSQSFFYKRRWVTVTRSQDKSGYYGRPEDRLMIKIMTRHHRFLNELLLEAKKEYHATQENNISIYVADSRGEWRHVASRPKRPLHSIVLDPGIKDSLINDARDFLSSKAWYAARGIPFRRGYLLHGAPGTGKTSIIHSLAGELGLDVYILSLSRLGMDDSSLSELTSDLPEKCIALMEDIDAAFTQDMNREESSSKSDEKTEDTPSAKPQDSSKISSRVTLSGLLNALDGVGAQEGRILFATTNKYDSLDPALCRPGRMDIHLQFKLASQFQARELYRYFYLPVGEGEQEDTSADSGDAKENSDSGYDSDSSEPARLIDVDSASEHSSSGSSDSSPSTSTTTLEPIVKESVPMSGHSHLERAPKLSRRKIMKLAAQFANVIPERKFSMASLQGYLMGYKTRPFDAVKDIAEWVGKELSEKALEAAPDIKTET